MKLRKFLSRNIVLVALAVAVFGRLIVSYPLNENLLEGTDFTAHAPKIWYIANQYTNYGDWNPFWYGGYPFLKYYSPLSYYIAAFFAFFTSATIAYKIVINFFFILTPLGFYIFVNEFKFTKEQQAAAILIFSFFPTNIYYFWNNAFTTIVNIVFCLFTWIFFKKYLEDKGNKNLVFASLFVGLSILIHQLTAFLNIILIFVWSATQKKFPIKPVLLGLLISSFWLVPFLLEFQKPLLKSAPEISTFIMNVTDHIGFSSFIILSLFLSLLILYSVRNENKESKRFLLVLLTAFFIVFATTHNRVLALMPIPFAIILSQIVSKNKSKIRNFIAVLLIIALTVSFFSFHPFSSQGHEPWETPEAKNRVIYLPTPKDFCLPNQKCDIYMYSVYLPLLKGQQVINGWFQESQSIGVLKGRKDVYMKNINEPLKFSDKEYYDLLNQGFVNSVVVNKFYTDYIKYFSESNYFLAVKESENFIVYDLQPQSTYIEINSVPAEATVKGGFNKIESVFECSPGVITIKETFDPWWNGYLNSEKINLEVNDYGFMQTKTNYNGLCRLELKYGGKI